MSRLVVVLLLLSASAVYMTLVTPYKSSCREIKNSLPHALSGLYDILIDNSVVTVYCEMAKYGGGFTFVPRDAVKKGTLPSLLKNIFTDRSRVLLRYQRKNGLQPYTLITQLRAYRKQKLNALLHSYAGYTRPLNQGLGDYIFLGILPASVARFRTTQGFKSNGKNVRFSNCDANPNSYFVFFPNHHERSISKYGIGWHYERRGVAVDWRKTGVPSLANRQMPNDFFFLTEIHFGGCGCYTSSDRWIDASGTAIGFY